MRRLILGLGRATEGQLGGKLTHKGPSSKLVATPSVLIEGVTAEARLAAGDALSAVVTDGRVFVTGRGKHGELGLGESMLSASDFCAVSLSDDKRASAVFTGHGASHTIFLDDEGIPHVAGTGSEGQLGLGGRLGPRGSYHGGQQEAAVFEPVPAREPFASRGERVVHAALSRHRTVFLTDAGHVYAAGTGFHGELGLGTVTYATEPTGWHEAPEQEFFPLAAAAAEAAEAEGQVSNRGDAASDAARVLTPGTPAAAAALGAAVDAAVAATAAARKEAAKDGTSTAETLRILMQQGDSDADESFDPLALSVADGSSAAKRVVSASAAGGSTSADAAAPASTPLQSSPALPAPSSLPSSPLPRFVSIACGLNFTIAASACGRLLFSGRIGKPGTLVYVGRDAADSGSDAASASKAVGSPGASMHSSLRPVELPLPACDGPDEKRPLQVAAGLQHAAITDGRRLWLLGAGFLEDTGTAAEQTSSTRAVGVGPHELHLERYIGFKPTSIRVTCGPYSTAIIADGKLYVMGRVESEALLPPEHSRVSKQGNALVGQGFGVFEDLVRPREDFAGRFVATLPSPTLFSHEQLFGEGKTVIDAALGAAHAIVSVEESSLKLR